MKPLVRTIGIVLGAAFAAGSICLGVSWLVGWNPLDAFRVRPDFADAVERIDLELDLRAPPRFVGKARLKLRDGVAGRIHLLLNRELEVERVADDSGRVLHCIEEGRLRSDYHREARVIAVDIAGPARAIELDYAGRGFDGSKQSDWMGVLLLAPDELRMSSQTVFYPQIPSEIDGPGKIAWPGRVRLLAPPELEAYAPGRACECSDAPQGCRAWCWESDAPTVLSLFAARRVRRETLLGDARVITLLAAEHARLGDAIAREVEKMLRGYAALWGPIGPRTLGIVEMKSRGASYNWTSDGIIAMESGALGGEVPIDTLAHETAHMWWGQEVHAGGRGERFLTEGLAEYAAWRYLASSAGEAAAAAKCAQAEQRWWTSVHKTGVDPALFDVRFASKGYTELAYAKGPVALWRLQRRLGVERMDALLVSYRNGMRGAKGDTNAADVFLLALRGVAASETIDISLLERDGHVHMGLRDVAFDGAKIRAVVVAEDCPEGAPAARIERVTVALYTEADLIRNDPASNDRASARSDVAKPLAPESVVGSSSIVRREVAMGDRREMMFEASVPTEVAAITVDPDGVLPGVSSPTVLRPGIGLLSSEPADGAKDIALGPIVAKLRFGTVLAEPAKGFAERAQTSCSSVALGEKSASFAVRSVSLEDGGHVLAISLDETQPGRTHVLVVPDGLRTVRGIPLPPARVRFTVKEAGDLPPPRIVATEPAVGARDVPTTLPRFKIVFSDPMRRARGYTKKMLAEIEGRGWKIPKLGESRWEDSRTLIWEIREPLERGRHYALPFGENYHDQMGVELKRFDLDFETER